MRKAVTIGVAAAVFAGAAALPGKAADLPPSRSGDLAGGGLARPSAGLGREALRPVPREWIVADAGAVVDASELVVLVPDEASADDVVRLATPLGYGVMRRDALDGLGQVLIVLRIPSGRTGPDAIAEIERLSGDATAGVNHAYPMPATPPGLDRMRYANALIDWPRSGCPAYASVGLIDTPIDPDMAQVLSARITTADFRRDPERQVGTQHGTALAALLAGEGRLIRPHLYNAVVAGDAGDLDDAAGVDDLMRALDWLAREDVRVVNISLAGPYNKILDLGVQSAAARGLVMVAAAGNDGPSANPRFPAAFDEVVAVTAVDADEDIYRMAVRGAHIDLSAPGVDVLLPLAEHVRFVSGTSVAAPFVSAALAANPQIMGPLPADDLVADLRRSARDVGQSGRDETFGFGILLAGGECP